MLHDKTITVAVRSYAKEVNTFQREDVEDMIQGARVACLTWDRNHPDEARGEGLTRLMTLQACRDFERATRRHRGADCLDDVTVPEEQANDDTEYQTQLLEILSKIVNDEHEASVALSIIVYGMSLREAAGLLGLTKQDVHTTIRLLRSRAERLGVKETA